MYPELKERKRQTPSIVFYLFIIIFLIFTLFTRWCGFCHVILTEINLELTPILLLALWVNVSTEQNKINK